MSDKFSTKLASFLDDLILNHTMAAIGAVILALVVVIGGLEILEQVGAWYVAAVGLVAALGAPVVAFLWKAPGLIRKHFFKK